jgi:hypothetical protein
MCSAPAHVGRYVERALALPRSCNRMFQPGVVVFGCKVPTSGVVLALAVI